MSPELRRGLDKELLQWGRDFWVADIWYAPGMPHHLLGCLQWGRDFWVADMGTSSATRSHAYCLQWGRDFWVADIARTLAALLSRLRRPRCERWAFAPVCKSFIWAPPYPKTPLISASASVAGVFGIVSPLAASSGYKNGILAQFALQRLGQQARLDLEQPSIADTIAEEGMCYKRLHSRLVGPEESLSTSGRQ